MNQHFVPRSYLKNFASAKDKEYFVDVYDKLEKRFFKTNIKRICSQIDMYTLQKESLVSKDPYVIENIYANGIEPLYIKAYGLLTNHRIRFINQLQRAEILIAIFQLYIRNPIIVKRSIAVHTIEIIRLWKESQEAGKKGMSYLGEDFSFNEWSQPEIIKSFSDKVTTEFKEKHIGGIGEISGFHEQAILEINVITDDAKFMTSDNPIIVSDHVADDDYPLAKSKVFFIALNEKIGLRLYHDKTKSLDQIYRRVIPNGSVASINQDIIKQSSRFVISNPETYEKHSKIVNDFLDNTSLELKIDTIRQILSKFPVTPENQPAVEIMQHYLAKYETDGTLTDLEVYEMHIKLKNVQARFIKSRVNRD